MERFRLTTAVYFSTSKLTNQPLHDIGNATGRLDWIGVVDSTTATQPRIFRFANFGIQIRFWSPVTCVQTVIQHTKQEAVMTTKGLFGLLRFLNRSSAFATNRSLTWKVRGCVFDRSARCYGVKKKSELYASDKNLWLREFSSEKVIMFNYFWSFLFLNFTISFIFLNIIN